MGVTKEESTAFSEMTPVSGIISSWGLFKLTHKHPPVQNKILVWKTGLKYPNEIPELSVPALYRIPVLVILFLIN